MDTKKYVLSCGVMLCSAKIEVYIEDFFDSWIDKVNGAALTSASLPNNLKTLYLNQPFLNNAYKKLITESSESKFIDLLTSELGNQHFNLTDPAKTLPTLYSKVIYQNKKYPSPDNLIGLYKRLGIKNIFTEINKISRSDLENTLVSFNSIRTAISHNGIPVGINDKDIIRTLRGAKRVISYVDKAIYAHIKKHSVIATWPS
ncbi:MAG: HEPN domain-containing protein [Bacteroidota bacterium]|nr:HEPN domain-containing protein [Bacteroidota bacterium]